MASKKSNDKAQLRDTWPRIRVVSIKGAEFFSVDGRPSYARKAFSTLAAARKQAERWEQNRIRYGKAGRFISEKDASRFAQALDILTPHGAGIVDAAKYYAGHLEAEKTRASSKLIADALLEWIASYKKKDYAAGSRVELASKAGIFSRAFGQLKLKELSRDALISWVEEYEGKPGQPATPSTRANLRTKLAMFLNFSERKGWIEKNPLKSFRLKTPPRAPVKILDVAESRRLIEAANRSEHRRTLLPYAAVCLFAGLRPNSEAEKLTWNDIHFGSGDIHVRRETSKVKEERYVPMEACLVAWLKTCPVRAPGPIIGPLRCKFRAAWEKVKREAGYRVGIVPENGWPALAQDWPVDGMRHTYASMWLAVHQSRAELAERMGNSESMIKSHYRRAIRPEAARDYWGIMPEAHAGGKILRMDGMA